MKRKTAVLVLSMILAFACAVSLIPTGTAAELSGAQTATSTYYVNHYSGSPLNGSKRSKLVTSKVSKTTSTSGKKILFNAKNKSTGTMTTSYTYSETYSSTVSLGAGVSIKVIELEVGTSVSYSTTETRNAEIELKSGESAKVIQYTKKEKTKYKTVFQTQKRLGSTWVKSGNASTQYSTVIKTYPVYEAQ